MQTYDEWRKEFHDANHQQPSPRDAWKAALQASESAPAPTNNASVAIAAFKSGYGAAKKGIAGYTALRNFAEWNGYNSALGE